MLVLLGRGWLRDAGGVLQRCVARGREALLLKLRGPICTPRSMR